MKRIFATLVVFLSLFNAKAKAQIYVGSGSTATGDILRGEGIAAWGWGQYNLNTAQGNSINADTMIKIDQYIGESRRAENARQARIRAENKARRLKYFNELQDRLLNAPEGADILAGNALNIIMTKLNSGRFNQTELGMTRVMIPVDIVRRIPFSVGETGHKISMSRMMHYGKSWPIAFEDEKFTSGKKRYDRAINHALSETQKSAIQQKTIKEVELAVEELNTVLLSLENAMNEKSFKEALYHLADLKLYPGLFGSQKPQEALIALDTYSGTTVEELRKFMDKYSLRFAPAERPGEREAYRAIYTALHMQGEALAIFEKNEEKK